MSFPDELSRQFSWLVYKAISGLLFIEESNFCLKGHRGSNISTTRKSVSSGYPSTEKLMKRPSAFIVSKCLDTLIITESRLLKHVGPKISGIHLMLCINYRMLRFLLNLSVRILESIGLLFAKHKRN